jgi:predicted kinase
MILDQLRKSDIILICGLPGSGKSHFARKYFKKSGRKRINRKEIRKNLFEMLSFNDTWDEKSYNLDDETLVKYIEKKIIDHLLFNGEKVVIDNISVSDESRKVYINLAVKMKKTISAVFINTDIDVCLERNRERDDGESVPESVIGNLSAGITMPEKREGFMEVAIINNPE